MLTLESVKSSILEIKEVVFGNHDVDYEKYSLELSERSSLSFDEIKDMFNMFYLYKLELDSVEVTRAKKRIWGKNEDNLLLFLCDILERQTSKEKVFNMLSEVLNDRTYYSLSFRYYELKKIDKNNNLEVVDSSESKEEPVVSQNKKDDTDLLDVVINLVDNVETVGLDVSSLFNDLLLMSNKAVENSNIEKLEILEGENSFLKSELDKEKEKNEQLQRDVAKVLKDFDRLKFEVETFDRLSGKDKLQQFNNFNRNIKYIVDKFGGVITVGLNDVG
ncbi:hypothetical protein PQE75_gp057 [Bacillus phage vB_BcoS-136]|uniref:Uncharacterized protein n=1 Tax=Bacillus phage vB_BcoS-136 TaxID=2419619 RepID=A0A3G3BVB6_9CAUD|nr:hypothetical protein PQE75_gp057 [Bacillus phage vB_BcoS-136]AYP68189.1 hypothetical protein vBBcoS136_00057 [Bacillus phage vB_BcoS-136]